MAATIRVVLGVNDASKLALPTGIPGSVADLKEEIKRHFGLSGNFRLQYRDTEFDNEFVNLSCTSDIKDKSTVKIIYLTNDTNASLPHHEPTASPQGVDNTSLSSFSSTSDTDILSSPGSSASASSGSSLRSQPWPHTFPLPQFNYEVDVQLEQANLAFHNSGTLLCPSTKLKSAILESLASEIIKYKMYPSSADLDDVSQALITKHPCLKEQGSVSGYYGWKISLKYKMANYRTRLRGIGCPELSINAMKEKDGSLNHSPNQVKKPRKAEVNYCPGYPAGESKESLEAERQALLVEVKKKNQEQIKNKMERTFAYRRQEIIQDMPFITELRSRWPALFSEREVDAEFARITTVPLRSTFMFQLDRHTDNLLKVFRKKGGAAGQKIKVILAAMDKDPSIEKRRDCVLKAVSVYLNEDPQHLIKEYMDLDPGAKKDMEETMMGVYVIWHEGAEDTDQAEDVGIIIEGVEVLQGLRYFANGCALLLGLIYSLNLSYPKDLRYTFEFVQKVLLDLDGNRMSAKVQVLKNRLHE
uniref:sterile alpha motif domain-containing protein 3-like n=1 Tax=Solea senegalensis TaxID=28829 RepID=UPI001CD86056|nr:sterile alpha motif domain-containing protein 3-like [Solea senegalensis]XP_043908843.1 sterile alpha motif domain-containing protein 3-like [Solea senegalensis]XP_043908850.1 sterile alpha motif domain-containing protein 3-like [Solea senegalensis]XP_043908860.1 sterile alpha motif domain-containing protein 3-like [Solea senegalensis]